MWSDICSMLSQLVLVHITSTSVSTVLIAPFTRPTSTQVTDKHYMFHFLLCMQLILLQDHLHYQKLTSTCMY